MTGLAFISPVIILIKDYYEVSSNEVQLTITIYLVAICISQIFWGPLSDLIGRRIVLLIGAGLFSLGGILTQYKEKVVQCIPHSLMIALISLIFQPLITIYFGRNIFIISEEELKSAVITAAMAPGVNAFIFSNMYKKSTEIAASSVILCTILSIISSALWISYIK